MYLNVKLCGMPPPALYSLENLRFVVITDLCICACVWVVAEFSRF